MDLTQLWSAEPHQSCGHLGKERCSLLSPLAKMHHIAAGDDDDELEGWLNSLGDSDENFNFDDWMNTDLASDDELDGETSSPMRPMDLVGRMS